MHAHACVSERKTNSHNPIDEVLVLFRYVHRSLTGIRRDVGGCPHPIALAPPLLILLPQLRLLPLVQVWDSYHSDILKLQDSSKHY